MTTLDFTLSPEAVVRLHDALVCLAKFNENVGLEASRDKVRSKYTLLNHISDRDVIAYSKRIKLVQDLIRFLHSTGNHILSILSICLWLQITEWSRTALDVQYIEQGMPHHSLFEESTGHGFP